LFAAAAAAAVQALQNCFRAEVVAEMEPITLAQLNSQLAFPLCCGVVTVADKYACFWFAAGVQALQHCFRAEMEPATTSA
jgi:hypothetical protein